MLIDWAFYKYFLCLYGYIFSFGPSCSLKSLKHLLLYNFPTAFATSWCYFMWIWANAYNDQDISWSCRGSKLIFLTSFIQEKLMKVHWATEQMPSCSEHTAQPQWERDGEKQNKEQKQHCLYLGELFTWVLRWQHSMSWSVSVKPPCDFPKVSTCSLRDTQHSGA